MDRYWYGTKRDVVCFKRSRFNLEKIEKNYFYCRRLQKSQNLRRNGSFSKFRLHAKGRKGDRMFSDASVHRGFYF